MIWKDSKWISVCLISQVKSFGVIWDHLESFKSWGDIISYTINMRRSENLRCPFLVSGYYRRRTLCIAPLRYRIKQSFGLYKFQTWCSSHGEIWKPDTCTYIKHASTVHCISFKRWINLRPTSRFLFWTQKNVFHETYLYTNIF